MATVRITGNIIWHVQKAITDMFNKRIEAKTAELDKLNIGHACYEHYIPLQYRQMASQLNEDPKGPWVPVAQYMYVSIKFTRPDGSEAIAHITVPFRPPAPLPVRFTDSHGGLSNRFHLLPGMPTYDEAKAVMLAVEDLQKERDHLLKQLVDGVLKKCTTLKQVLEHWPSVMDFLPESVHQLHAAPQEKRAKPTKAEIAIDDNAKAAMIKARLLNTQNGSSE